MKSPLPDTVLNSCKYADPKSAEFLDNRAADLSTEELTSFTAFKTWTLALTETLNAQSSPSHPYHKNPYHVKNIQIQSIDRFKGGRLGFIKLKADIRTEDDQTLPGSVFLRGGSVAMMLVLTVSDMKDSNEKEKAEYLILTTQPRIPAGTLSFTEIPAGMLDDSGTFSGAAAKEIKEETGLEIREDELIDLTSLASKQAEDSDAEGSTLQNAIYPSPGGSDEFVPIFLVRKDMKQSEIDDLQGKLTGLRGRGEKISLKIVKLKDAWKVAGRDAKCLAGLCLLDGLRREASGGF